MEAEGSYSSNFDFEDEDTTFSELLNKISNDEVDEMPSHDLLAPPRRDPLFVLVNLQNMEKRLLRLGAWGEHGIFGKVQLQNLHL